MLLQNAPATFDGIVFAVVGRKVEELYGLAGMAGKFNHPKNLQNSLNRA